MATRDQWYKPNLLYNIHYRPPKKVEPPKLIVETTLFNPSVCTCGEHGCEPKYRMERKVLWSHRETDRVEQEETTGEVQKIVDGKDQQNKERIKSDQGDVQYSGGRNQYNDGGNGRAGIGVGHDDRKIKTDFVGRRSNDDVRVRNDSGYGLGKEKITVAEIADQDKGNGSYKRDDKGSVADEKIKIDDAEIKDAKFKDIIDGSDGECFSIGGNGKKLADGVGSQCNGDGSVRCDGYDGEADKKSYIDGVASQCNSDVAIIVNGDVNVTAEDVCQDEEFKTQDSDEEISSGFGIMSVYCNSELHSWRMFKGEDESE